MKWIVLGWQSPHPGPFGATPGYLVQTASGNLLIDCGSGVLSRLLARVSLADVTAVILSHYHADHVSDLGVLQYAAMMAVQRGERATPITVYAPRQPEADFARAAYKTYVQAVPIDEDAPLHLAGVTVRFHRTAHPVPCYAVRLDDGERALAYTADTGPDTDWGAFLHDVDLLVAEATYRTADAPAGARGHLTAAEAGALARRYGARRLLLTHLYPGYDADVLVREAQESFAGPVLCARDGLEVSL